MRYLNDATVAEFLAGPRLRLLVFGTGTDLSSQVFGRQLTEFDDLTGTRMQIGVLDVEQSPETTAEWGVGETLPIQILFQDGVMQQVLRGVRSPKALWQAMNDYLEPPTV
ncbi:hypothetical protein SAMN05216298_0300 [Glycomyces sambucus]|uniref:Thioredoxin n=1 Tax=Glycomyces sambucus TaxID=380244 RepID=A0A1G9CFL0_9ACTN|nr:hypothetical protein [Glycomyces sambucus]SDK50215.1 hypothetical protein SAMN05216298_0300 [Glycomyces sambucus]